MMNPIKYPISTSSTWLNLLIISSDPMSKGMRIGKNFKITENIKVEGQNLSKKKYVKAAAAAVNAEFLEGSEVN